ncbi:unnamed protein product [Gongylonema pulchrum]|uniref:3-oxoacyl-[acyl-carrier-protein] reductase n=1 Tax=Gongylonema pulchrum TaxID=637853 RepID=A0A183E4M2_9BILA|nr:unnamed protein product [Gongylonema pulchrum]
MSFEPQTMRKQMHGSMLIIQVLVRKAHWIRINVCGLYSTVPGEIYAPGSEMNTSELDKPTFISWPQTKVGEVQELLIEDEFILPLQFYIHPMFKWTIVSRFWNAVSFCWGVKITRPGRRSQQSKQTGKL